MIPVESLRAVVAVNHDGRLTGYVVTDLGVTGLEVRDTEGDFFVGFNYAGERLVTRVRGVATVIRMHAETLRQRGSLWERIKGDVLPLRIFRGYRIMDRGRRYHTDGDRSYAPEERFEALYPAGVSNERLCFARSKFQAERKIAAHLAREKAERKRREYLAKEERKRLRAENARRRREEKERRRNLKDKGHENE